MKKVVKVSPNGKRELDLDPNGFYNKKPLRSMRQAIVSYDMRKTIYDVTKDNATREQHTARNNAAIEKRARRAAKALKNKST